MRLRNYINEVTKMSPMAVERFIGKYKYNILKAIKNSKNISNLCKMLNKIFNKKNIIFNFSRSNDYIGVVGGKFDFDKEKIVIYLGNETPEPEDLDDFVGDLASTVGHEFIHMFQSIKSGGLESKEHIDIKSYIKSHPELEAYAYDVFSELRKGKTEKLTAIKIILKDDKKEWQKFLKKVYIYSKNDKKALELLKQYKFLDNIEDFEILY